MLFSMYFTCTYSDGCFIIIIVEYAKKEKVCIVQRTYTIHKYWKNQWEINARTLQCAKISMANGFWTMHDWMTFVLEIIDGRNVNAQYGSVMKLELSNQYVHTKWGNFSEFNGWNHFTSTRGHRCTETTRRCFQQWNHHILVCNFWCDPIKMRDESEAKNRKWPTVFGLIPIRTWTNARAHINIIWNLNFVIFCRNLANRTKYIAPTNFGTHTKSHRRQNEEKRKIENRTCQ